MSFPGSSGLRLGLMAISLLLGPFLSPARAESSETKPAWISPSTPYTFEQFLLVPLRIHLLSATNALDWSTTLTETDIQRILGKANGIWGQAGVHFYLETLVHESSLHQENYADWKARKDLVWLLQLRPVESRGSNHFDIYYIKQFSVNGVYLREAIFVKDAASLRKIPGGIDEPLPRVTSHELGHALGLSHRQAVTNLMASGTTGFTFSTQEIETARQRAAQKNWILAAPAALKLADDLFNQGQRAEARLWYQRLAELPLKAPEVEKAIARAHP